MDFKILPSHVAILVPSVEKAAEFLKKFEFQIGEASVWEGEGTKEIYVEVAKGNSLLLMEPIKEGAYQRALDKRGPGLHHLAIDVLDIESYIESLAGSGWLLHPMSLRSIKEVKTAYLARPGFPGLIEVQQKAELIERPLFVEQIIIPFEAKLTPLLKPIGLDSIVKQSSAEVSLSLGGKTIVLKDLY